MSELLKRMIEKSVYPNANNSRTKIQRKILSRQISEIQLEIVLERVDEIKAEIQDIDDKIHALKIKELKKLQSVEKIERETIVVATYGYNDVLNKPFEMLYEFGYYNEYGCVVYKKGERNMQDASAFKLSQIRRANPEDIKECIWG